MAPKVVKLPNQSGQLTCLSAVKLRVEIVSSDRQIRKYPKLTSIMLPYYGKSKYEIL